MYLCALFVSATEYHLRTPILESCLFLFGGKSQRGCLDRWSLVSSWATTDLAGRSALGSIRGAAFQTPLMVLCSEFVQVGELQEFVQVGKRWRKGGSFSRLFTFQKSENKSDRLSSRQDPRHPMPLLRPCLRQGLRCLPKQLSLHSPVGSKLTPLQIFQLLHS